MNKKVIFKIFTFSLLFALMAQPALAFLYDDVQFKTKEEIKQLSDEDLFEIYVDTKVIEKTSQEFHISAGFSNAKEYKKRRKLIRFLFDLRLEMSRRDSIDAEKIDKNLK